MTDIKHMGLQYFAEPASEQQPAQAAAGAQTTAAQNAELAAALLAAVNARTSRAETSVAKSFAEQYSMTEDEVNAILRAEKERRAKDLPADVKAQVDAQLEHANKLLIAAAVRAEGAALGLVDADAAVLLMDGKSIKVGEDGAVTGVKEALEALQKTKPYLFGAAAATTTGIRQAGAAPLDKRAEANAALRAVFGR